MTAQEIAPKLIELGHEQITFPELDMRLRKLGYKRDKRLACNCIAKIMTGELAGETHPCRTYNVTHIKSKLSFANVDAPRDANFKALQEMRQTVFVVRAGRINEI